MITECIFVWYSAKVEFDSDSESTCLEYFDSSDLLIYWFWVKIFVLYCDYSMCLF